MKSSLTLAATLLLGVLAYPAAAQEGRPAPVVEIAAGQYLFPDDSLVREGFFGGTVRFPVTPRLSLGPEVAYVAGRNHYHLVASVNMTYDVVGPAGGRDLAVTPFFTVGGGLFSSRGTAPFGTTTYNEGAFTAGGGVRARVGERTYVGGEVRLGWELHVRVNAFVGVRLGK